MFSLWSEGFEVRVCVVDGGESGGTHCIGRMKKEEEEEEGGGLYRRWRQRLKIRIGIKDPLIRIRTN